jgi:cytochrome oxidase Cu insertion factor (SCO1/SenC/PrrC family)
MRSRPWSIPLALAAALAVAIAVAALSAGGSGGGRESLSTATNAGGFDGAPFPPGTRAPGFTLTDQSGRRVSLGGYRGQMVVLAFLDSHCAPACVLIAQQIRGALDELQRPVPVLFVSVAPAVDTPASAAGFLAGVSLMGRVRYLAAPRAALPALWRAYRIATPAAGRAAFERAASVFLIDASGNERVIYQQEQLTPESLAHDVRKLQSEG